MDDVINVHEQFYILATSAFSRDQSRVLKHGKTFGVFDRYGDIEGVGLPEQGLFHEGTRFLSAWALRTEQGRPLLLSSAVRKDNSLLTVDLSNLDIHENGEVAVPRGSLHIARARFLWRATCYEQLRVSNYSLVALEFPLSLRFQADFADIFEVRGTKRERRGRRLPDVVEAGAVTLAYEGLDGVVRKTRIRCWPEPSHVSASEMRLKIVLPPGGQATFLLSAACEIGDLLQKTWSHGDALIQVEKELSLLKSPSAEIYSSNAEFNDWLNQSLADLSMMMAGNPEGGYPYAGVPWFNTVFGRDGIITALECLWMDPSPAKGVLAYLASTQAREHNAEADAQPGKIVHETRRGEMAALGEVPFGCYYGSVDATPLFILLAGAYFERTADRAFIESIWPSIRLALDWIDMYGDADGDGFVEYVCRSHRGLVHQGWKDSKDSVFHADGTLADGPIALCEVQGYVYAAKLYAAKLAFALGQREQADSLRRQAAELQQNFEQAFWCEELSMYALALDGSKQPCRVRTSNAGHALFAGIASPEHARLTAQTLLSEDFFSGWGIRTLANDQVRYNPMSYHNGSVWPHDNALMASGLARYESKECACKVFDALFEASTFLELHRLPELFCGFNRRHGEGPTLYPVACSPQSWSAASAFCLLGSSLGISIDAARRQVISRQPVLPESIRQLRLRNLRVGDASVDLSFERLEHRVDLRILQKRGDLQIHAVGVGSAESTSSLQQR